MCEDGGRAWSDAAPGKELKLKRQGQHSRQVLGRAWPCHHLDLAPLASRSERTQFCCPKPLVRDTAATGKEPSVQGTEGASVAESKGDEVVETSGGSLRT